MVFGVPRYPVFFEATYSVVDHRSGLSPLLEVVQWLRIEEQASNVSHLIIVENTMHRQHIVLSFPILCDGLIEI
jgi:hypothetical protein